MKYIYCLISKASVSFNLRYMYVNQRNCNIDSEFWKDAFLLVCNKYYITWKLMFSVSRYTMLCSHPFLLAVCHVRANISFSAKYYCYSPLGRIPDHHTDGHLIPSIFRFPWQTVFSYLWPWVERGSMRVNCPFQQHNTMSRPRALASYVV